MKFSKITKIVTALVMVGTVALSANMVFADTSISIPKQTNTGYAGTGLSDTMSNILGIVTVICYAAAVIMLLYLGVKYITASPEGKAEIKKTAIQYVIGAVLVFAAGTVLNIIKNIAGKTVTDSGN